MIVLVISANLKGILAGVVGRPGLGHNKGGVGFRLGVGIDPNDLAINHQLYSDHPFCVNGDGFYLRFLPGSQLLAGCWAGNGS